MIQTMTKDKNINDIARVGGLKHFSLVTAGDNPDEFLKKYDLKLEVTPYLVYEGSKANYYKENYISLLNTMVSDDKLNLPETAKKDIIANITKLKEMDDQEFFSQMSESNLSDGCFYDPKTNNILSNHNPAGKWMEKELGGNYTITLVKKDGTLSTNLLKSDIDWDILRNKGKNSLAIAWDTVVDKKIPVTEKEKKIFFNMKDKKDYLISFKTKNNYISVSSSWWAYAFVDKDNWYDMDDGNNIGNWGWMTGFYDRFIDKLPNDTLISVYSCIR